MDQGPPGGSGAGGKQQHGPRKVSGSMPRGFLRGLLDASEDLYRICRVYRALIGYNGLL